MATAVYRTLAVAPQETERYIRIVKNAYIEAVDRDLFNFDSFNRRKAAQADKEKRGL